jgi:hypothetical protein
MAAGQGIRRVSIDPSTWDWGLPAALRHKLDAMATLADTDRLGSGRPLPAKHQLEILGQLLDHLLPDGTTEHLPETAARLSEVQRAYLAALVHQARRELDKAQATAPSTLLGLPPDTRGAWANLLGAGWLPMQPGWIAQIRK